MFINPDWRILTIGDGDLSFSASLLKNYHPRALTATVYDSRLSLSTKYSQQYLQQLRSSHCSVLTDFDVTNEASWGRLTRHQFDLVIFQFPLIPAFSNADDFHQQCKNISLNTLHRRLLRRYLINCFDYFLAKDGAQLAFITSKDVKPYRQWNIEHSLIVNTNIHYQGSMIFNLDNFPDYHIRNVDRDKYVKSTDSITYVFSRLAKTELEHRLLKPSLASKQNNYCLLCRVGPFSTEQDKKIHFATNKHRKMQQYERQWLDDLSNN